MAGYRDLPMGRHEMEVMTGPEPVAVFERYVRVKRELLTVLQDALWQDDTMLAMMQATEDGA